MKEIASVLKILEKSNLHIADIGKRLSHLSNFEGPSLVKTKQSNDTEIKQLELKRKAVLNSSARLKTERTEYLNINGLIEGKIDQSISNQVFEVPQLITEIVEKVQTANLADYFSHFEKVARYLNPKDSQPRNRVKGLELLSKIGDISFEKMKALQEEKSEIEDMVEPFEYERYLNLKGFYNVSLDNKPVELENWGIEEVSQEANIDKWEIVEESAENTTEPAVKTLQNGPSMMLSQEFRAQIDAEVEEMIFFFSERVAQANSPSSILLFDKDLSSIFNEFSLEKLKKALEDFHSIQNCLNNPKFLQKASLIDSEKAKGRILNGLESIDGLLKRKERQAWKLQDSIKELQSANEDCQVKLQALNRQVGKLCRSVEELLGKVIKRRVILTKTTF